MGKSAGADRIFALIENGAELRALWEEFDAMETPDALYAISLDRLQPFLANCLNKGDTWFAGGVSKEAILKRMAPVEKGIPALWETVLRLIDENVENGYVCEK